MSRTDIAARGERADKLCPRVRVQQVAALVLALCVAACSPTEKEKEEGMTSSAHIVTFDTGSRDLDTAWRAAREALAARIAPQQWHDHSPAEFGTCGGGLYRYYTPHAYFDGVLAEADLAAVDEALAPLGFSPDSKTRPKGKGFRATLLNEFGDGITVTSLEPAGTILSGRTACRLQK